MIDLNDSVLKQFQKAVERDYGVRLEGDTLKEGAYMLFQYFQFLIKNDPDGKMAKKILEKSERLS